MSDEEKTIEITKDIDLKKAVQLGMCKAHWGVLQAAINTAGLGHLVSKNIEESKRRMASTDPKDRDPLTCAYMAIQQFFMENHHPDDIAGEGEACTLCLIKHAGEQPDLDKNWIEGAVSEEMKIAHQNGLLVQGKVH